MTPEQIEAELSRSVEIAVPKTMADLLTAVFDDDWRLRRDILQKPYAEDSVLINLTLKFTVSAETARVHLERLMEIERQQRKAK